MRAISLVPLVLVACGQREVLDNANVCFTMPETLPGVVTAEVVATGGQNGPQNGSCFVDRTLEGNWQLTTVFYYDRQFNPLGSEVAILRVGSASCTAEIDGEAPWVVHYRDDTESVPVDGGIHCFVTTFEGGFEPAPETYEPWTFE